MTVEHSQGPGGEHQETGHGKGDPHRRYGQREAVEERRQDRPGAAPEVDDPAWAENPIDAFIYDRLAENGLEPSPEADLITLIRRATYNLTGLPPTPEEIEAFVNDDRTDAWERVIDRLLESPHYGEQWARHWMDLARYAETNGYERDDKKRNIWRYHQSLGLGYFEYFQFCEDIGAKPLPVVAAGVS